MPGKTVRKLVDRVDILKDLVQVVTPVYFPKEALDKNRTSIYGYLTEAMSQAIEDTITLEQRRANDYCPELSNSEIRVNQTAKLWGVGVTRAVPGRCLAMLSVLKEDILRKGVKVRDEIQFTIDRRSTILYGGYNFSLEDDILIRAVKRGNSYYYAANYTGEHSSYDSYIQMFEDTNDQGELLVSMICQIYQCNYTITEMHVTDLLEFTYDGISFDYDYKLAGFEVYYKRSANDQFKKATLDHYLTMTPSKALYYNDDESNLLRIINNPVLNIGINGIIRAEIKQTLGEDIKVTIDRTGTATFAMYRDAAYNYSGVNVFVTMLSDVVGAMNGDSLLDVKKKLIDKKVRRENITTEHDIIQYINDLDANVQLIKKRNDCQEHNYYVYVLMRYGDRKIAPTTTKRLNLTGVRTIQNLGDFDRYDKTVDRKLIRAYSKFKLHIVDGFPDYDYVTKCPIDENEPDALYLTCPYMMIINDLNIVSYYFTSVDETARLSMQVANNIYPYQMITQGVHIYRNAHSAVDNDRYTFTIKGMLNTENDSLLVDDEGYVIDSRAVMCYLFFTKDGSPCAYLPMMISEYDKNTREFIFTGSIRTSDYITELDRLEIVEGLRKIGTDTNYNSVIDYRDASFTACFFHKADPTTIDEYPRNDSAYTMLPTENTDGYVLMNSYYNNPNNLYSLILEFGKFSRSPTKVLKVTDTTYDYSIGAVPFFEFNFGIENTASLYDTFKNMTVVYGSMLKLTTGFDIALKFIATYGPSKYITISGGRIPDEYETTAYLNDLNPTFYFKVYGFGAPLEEIYDFIYKYLRDNYITEDDVFMSNICTAVEENFATVRSIKYMGCNDFDASYQHFRYNKPVFISEDIITRYVPEQLNVTDIQIELDET